jgi:hypothetical protein
MQLFLINHSLATKKYSYYKLHPSFRGCKFEEKYAAYIHVNMVITY